MNGRPCASTGLFSRTRPGAWSPRRRDCDR